MAIESNESRLSSILYQIGKQAYIKAFSIRHCDHNKRIKFENLSPDLVSQVIAAGLTEDDLNRHHD